MKSRSDELKWQATMTQDGKTVTLKIGSFADCLAALDVVSGTPGITMLGVERVRDLVYPKKGE